MNANLFKVLGQYAGLAGFCIGLILIVFQAVLKSKAFRNTTSPDSYKLLRLLISLTFAIGVIGIVAWTLTTMIDKPGHHITGHVEIKDTHQPIEGAQIYFGGIAGSTASDNHGNFDLPLTSPLPASGASLYASQVGFDLFKQEKVIDDQNVDIALVSTKPVAQIEQPTRPVQQQSPTHTPPARDRASAANGPLQQNAPPIQGAAPTGSNRQEDPVVTQIVPAAPAVVTREQLPSNLPLATTAAAQNVSVIIDTARLNQWFQIGANGNGGFWPKSIRMSIDDQNFVIASNLTGINPSTPAINQKVTLEKGKHSYGFQVELDEKVAKTFHMGSIHQSIFPECRKEIEIDHDLKLNPFVTVKGSQIAQCLMLTGSDPIPDRTR